MPTIEIISIGCDSVPDFSHYAMFRAIAEVGRLKSHRGIFQEIFDKERGVIVHLGNNSLPDEPGPWYAHELIDWKKVDANAPVGSKATTPCIFKKSVKPEIRHLLSDLLNRSPVRKVIFSTDYQFTDNPAQEEGPVTLPRFTELLEHDAIPFNTLFWFSDTSRTMGSSHDNQQLVWRRAHAHCTHVAPRHRRVTGPARAKIAGRSVPAPRHPPAFAHTD